MSKKMVVIASNTKMFFNFREDLVKSIIAHEYEVSAIVPESGLSEKFEENNIKEIVIDMNKNTTSLFKNIKYIFNLKKILKNEKPDIIFSYTIKPIILGSIAAHLNKMTNVYSMVTGLGHIYSDNSFKTRIIRLICGVGYKVAFRYNKKVIFQNIDDINEVVKRRYIKREKCELVNGSGVNMKKFERTPLPTENIFLMVSRVLKEKGVIEYFEAAKIMKQKYKNAHFMFVGKIDKTNYAVDVSKLREYVDEGIVELVSETDDVASYLKKCRYFVLPTYYREGVPRVILEALSVGRPIITTFMPGCKETVVNGKNGYFVKIKDVDDLVSKMELLINDDKKVEAMASESHKLCKKKFDVNIINNKMLKIMGIK